MSIYVLRSDNLVKIGFSDDIRKRVGAIIGAVPVPVEFVGHMPGGRDVEAHLHQVFSKHHFSGEWFVETPEMRAVFAAILTPRLPEILTDKSKKRTAEADALREMSDRIKQAAAKKWPNITKGKRLDALTDELGWNPARVKDLYYCHPKMALRAFEQEELALWLAPELRDE